MSWSYGEDGFWYCSSYSDLTRQEVNNFAEFGQPMRPGENGYIPNLKIDFGNIVVKMPQSEVMTKGYGRMIKPDSFPIVVRFLREAVPAGLPPVFDFQTLVKSGFARADDRVIGRSLYLQANWDEQYVHGTVGFALMAESKFFLDQGCRSVDAMIGALDDNWDFKSSNDYINSINPVIAAIWGPGTDHLKAPIKLQYWGPGKRMRSNTCPLLRERTVPDRGRQPNLRTR